MDPLSVAPPAGSDFYYAALYFPPTIRRRIHVLEALRREIGRIPSTTSDRGVAHIKLNWWLEELRNAGSGNTRHDLTRAALAVELDKAGALDALAIFNEHVIEAMVPRRYADDSELRAALTERSAPLANAFVQISDGSSPQLDAAAARLLGLVDQAYELCAFRDHRSGPELLLSEAFIASHGSSPARLRETIHGEEVATVLAPAMRALDQELEAAIAALSRTERRTLRLFVTLARIRRRALALTLAAGCPVLERRIELMPLEKLWLAWRARHFG